MTRSHSLRVHATLALAVLLALSLTPASAQLGSDADTTDFLLFGNFVLEIDGEIVDGAELYHSPGRKGVLVRSSELSSPALVVPAGKRVEIYADEELLDNGRGRLRMLEGAKPSSTTTFVLDKSGPRWDMDGHQVRLVANPPLMGAHDREGLLDHDPAYRFKSEQFVPVADHMQALAAFDGAVRVKVYFGSWCSVCAELLPGILRVDEELEKAKAAYSFEYYGLPRDYRDPEAQQQGITKVPTGVVWVNGRRVGQINSTTWKYPAMALRNLIYGVRSEVERRLDETGVPTPPG